MEVYDVVIAGGCESMSNVEHYTTDVRRGVRAMPHAAGAVACSSRGGPPPPAAA